MRSNTLRCNNVGLMKTFSVSNVGCLATGETCNILCVTLLIKPILSLEVTAVCRLHWSVCFSVCALRMRTSEFGETAAGGVSEPNARGALMRELTPPIETKFMRFVFLTTLIETWETRNITDKMFQVVFENWLWYGINVEREQILTFGIILIVVSFRFQRKTALLTTADEVIKVSINNSLLWLTSSVL